MELFYSGNKIHKINLEGADTLETMAAYSALSFEALKAEIEHVINQSLEDERYRREHK